MAKDLGATNQDEFNQTVSGQAMVNYTTPATGGVIQDALRKDDVLSAGAQDTGAPASPAPRR